MMNANGNTQQHVLWAFCDFSVQAQQVRALKGLETEVIVVVVPRVIDVIVEDLCVVHDDGVHFF